MIPAGVAHVITGVAFATSIVTVFVAVDHCSGECVGIHAARSGNRFEALERAHEGHLGRAGVDLLRGNARVSGSNEVEIAGRRVSARYILLAPGSVPVLPAIGGIERAITSDGVFELRTQPSQVTIAGRFDAQGWATGAAIANSVIYGEESAFDRGFDFFAGLHGDDAAIAKVESHVADALAKHPKVTRLIYPGRPDHPQAEQAKSLLTLFLSEDHGTNWPAWEEALRARLQANP